MLLLNALADEDQLQDDSDEREPREVMKVSIKPSWIKQEEQFLHHHFAIPDLLSSCFPLAMVPQDIDTVLTLRGSPTSDLSTQARIPMEASILRPVRCPTGIFGSVPCDHMHDLLQVLLLEPQSI